MSYKIIDINSVYIDESASIGNGVIIHPNVVISGNTIIGDNTIIDSNSVIKDSVIGDNNYILSSIILSGNVIGDNNKIGPFTHIRENNIIGDNNTIGNYVEIKNSNIGSNNNIRHLAYVGDVDMGDNVNIGAGVIFANYHPKKGEKYKSIVEHGVKIGSNCTIVAPVLIGRGSMISAGSTIKNDISDNSLYISLEESVYKEGYYKGDKNDS